MSQDFKACLNCRFYEDIDSTCVRYPPVFTGYRFSAKENMELPEWRHPDIDIDWAEWCGEWQPAEPDQTMEERRAQIKQQVDEWAAANPELAMRAKEQDA